LVFAGTFAIGSMSVTDANATVMGDAISAKKNTRDSIAVKRFNFFKFIFCQDIYSFLLIYPHLSTKFWRFAPKPKNQTPTAREKNFAREFSGKKFSATKNF
jgi:hypothetical protein